MQSRQLLDEGQIHPIMLVRGCVNPARYSRNLGQAFWDDSANIRLVVRRKRRCGCEEDGERKRERESERYGRNEVMPKRVFLTNDGRK